MVKLEDVVESLTGYIESRIEIVKLDVKNEVSRVSVNVGVGAIVGLFAVLVVFCLTVALGLWLGDLVCSRPLGFVLAAVVFILISGILLASKAALQRTVSKRVFPKYKN